ncbi:MAG: Re/Si-specific NAD(P)(+) transhydrogenase subunit alpha [Bacteroidota bacterium]
MIIAIPSEASAQDKRVAMVPETIQKLIENTGEDSKPIAIRVESEAGQQAHYADDIYAAAGAEIVTDREALYKEVDLVIRLNRPTQQELEVIPEGAAVLSFMGADDGVKPALQTMRERSISYLGMELIPRISRAQSMDALSSMSSLAGYKSAILAADHLQKYLPMMMTAAGTIPPAKVLVLGAGVAGLQAIATAKRLGAVVEAFDVRPAVKEQVESLGATFVEVPLEEEETETKGGYAKELSEKAKQKQREVIHEHVKKSDIVITTALIPGRPAPTLITDQMVEDMKAGSVIVDLAAANGGNCTLSEADKEVLSHDVTILGPTNLPGEMAQHASLLYSRNVMSLLKLFVDEGQLVWNFEDEIVKETVATHQGEWVSPTAQERYQLS